MYNSLKFIPALRKFISALWDDINDPYASTENTALGIIIALYLLFVFFVYFLGIMLNLNPTHIYIAVFPALLTLELDIFIIKTITGKYWIHSDMLVFVETKILAHRLRKLNQITNTPKK